MKITQTIDRNRPGYVERLEKLRTLCSAASYYHVKERKHGGNKFDFAEDAEPVSEIIKLADGTIVHFLIIADGVGGSATGRRVTAEGSEKSGAYLASHVASGEVKRYLLEHPEVLASATETLLAIIKEKLIEIFTALPESYPKVESALGGSLLKDFATTFLITFTFERKDYTETTIFWSGDSSAYISVQECLYQTQATLGKSGLQETVVSHQGKVAADLKWAKIISPKDIPVAVVTISDGIEELASDTFASVFTNALKVENTSASMLRDNILAELEAAAENTDDGTIAVSTTSNIRQGLQAPREIITLELNQTVNLLR